MPNKAADNIRGRVVKSYVDITYLAKENDGKLPDKIQVLPVAKLNTEFYGPMEITHAMLQEMVVNFNNGVRKAVPVDVDHDGGKAAGWINKLEATDDGLYAEVEWTPYGSDLLTNKEYRLFSPEWSFNYVDPEYGSRHGAVLVAGSLTNRPLLKELPLLASDKTANSKQDLTNGKGIMILLAEERNMDIKTILDKPVADRSPEEVKFLQENSADFTPEQKTQFEKETADAANADGDTGAGANKDNSAENTDPATQSDKEVDGTQNDDNDKGTNNTDATDGDTNTANDKDKTVTIKASEHQKMVKELETLKAKERRAATEKEIATFVANENGGKIYPASKDKVVDLVLTFSDEQKKSFIELLNTLPDLKVAGEKGDSSRNHLTASEQVVKLIEDIRKADDKLTEAQAQEKVQKENPELYRQYKEELEGTK